MTYQDCLNYLFSQLPMYQKIGNSAYKKDLNRTIELCKLLDNPEHKFKSIHIAGTNGKGSVAHMLSSIFQTAGYKTGLYTSPHLKDFRERIKINGECISEEKVIEFVKQHKTLFKKIQPSFFEWTVAFAFDYFAKEKVDIAIIETGLGGRLDSTNVILPELSIITNIGLDHTDILGDTLEKIAIEKAGIIKDNIPIVIGSDSGQKAIFDKIAEERNAKIYYSPSEELSYPSDLKGFYQKQNIQTVITSAKIMNNKGWNISNTTIKTGLNHVVENTGLQGRWQQLKEKPKTIVDTAHNKEGFYYIWQQLKKEKYQQLHMVLGFVKERDLTELFKYFPRNAQYYFCQAQIPRALEVNLLKKIANNNGLIGEAYSSVKNAYSAALESASDNDFIYIGGSNFIVAEVI